MTWRDLEEGDIVNRPSELPPGDLVRGEVDQIRNLDRYNNMKVKGVNIEGKVVDDSPLYFTKYQEIKPNQNYLILYDLRTELTIPVRESIIDELWDEYLYNP
jgi:hypothetical protein